MPTKLSILETYSMDAHYFQNSEKPEKDSYSKNIILKFNGFSNFE